MFNIYASDYRLLVDEIPLGNQGEEDARCLVVDITDVVNEFGTGGSLAIRNQRPGETVPYPVSKATLVSGTDAQGNPKYYAKWTLTPTDTAKAGSGYVQVRYEISEVKCFTWVYKYVILPSLIPAGDVPDPYEDWLDELEELAGETRANAAAAEASAGESAGSAAESKYYADHIGDPVSGIVTEWLNEHIDPESEVVIDTSLQVSGAAADSKVVGDTIAHMIAVSGSTIFFSTEVV